MDKLECLSGITKEQINVMEYETLVDLYDKVRKEIYKKDLKNKLLNFIDIN